MPSHLMDEGNMDVDYGENIGDSHQPEATPIKVDMEAYPYMNPNSKSEKGI